VGELLLAMLIEDMGKTEQAIVIEGDTISPTRTVVVNKPEADPLTGMAYMSNDIQRTRLLVAMEDVPSTSSFRAQQLSAMSEAVKALPAELQRVALPFMVNLMDLPHKRELVDAIKAASEQQTPEQMREQVKQEVMHDLKMQELAIREREVAARERLLNAQTVQTGVQASYSAMQGAVQVAQMPQIAPIADVLMQGAGYRKPNPGGDDPNYPTPEKAAAMNIRSPYVQGQGAEPGSEQLAAMQPRENTSPAFPPVPREPGTGQQGIETPDAGDNLPAA
jgi:hypothetical protein